MSLSRLLLFFFSFYKFSLTSTIVITIDGYDNKVIYIFVQSRRALSQH